MSTKIWLSSAFDAAPVNTSLPSGTLNTTKLSGIADGLAHIFACGPHDCAIVALNTSLLTR
eukprot:CAMPEP_0202829832 /NCGR_PEP_ID=MMETSP1389-20130828/15776_1 /ASSEMBLY_ACC=CAM_ASM_000865 /TAXON_ID=302021 /ORGANISM="Rhodomonas sp., Strain CCMP768" /LENGTH=60 /DNA_ID=CAMNT_0049503425 /DNA_START=82 /DNA_END=260 /DNA_ORIENTATION=+